MSVCLSVVSVVCCCDELITRPEESYGVWCVVVCDLETSRIRCNNQYFNPINPHGWNVANHVLSLSEMVSPFKSRRLFFAPRVVKLLTLYVAYTVCHCLCPTTDMVFPCHGDGLCSLWGRNVFCVYNLYECRSWKCQDALCSWNKLLKLYFFCEFTFK